MTCYLLHMVEMPDPDAYRDAELKDLVGELPQLFCAYCTPPRRLKPSESARCLDRDGPCWGQPDELCRSGDPSA